MQFTLKQIDTKRVSIRLIQETDNNCVFKIYSNKVAMAYWSCLPFKSDTQSLQLINQAISDNKQGNASLLAIVLNDTGELIGTMKLFNISHQSRRAEIGYILDSKHWRKGLMKESLDALIHYCFHELKINRLEADIDPKNKASAALLKKLGFQLEGVLKERWIIGDQITDSEIYGLIKSQYTEV